MELEVWKPIQDYPNYDVSNYGNVKSKKRESNCCYNSKRTTKDRIIKQSTNLKGYYTVCLFKNGKHTKTVHKLVASTFLDNRENYNCVNHIDGNKKNNNVENLEWCSYSHNIKESYRLNLQRPSENQKEVARQYCIANKIKSIVQLDMNGNFIKEWKSAVEAENKLNINRKNISQCITKRNKSAGGYKWVTKEQFSSMEYKVN